MNFNNYLNRNSIYSIFLIIATILILPKWISSYIFFDDDIILRAIYEASDIAYIPIINSFSDLNFANSYSENVTNLKLISFPVIGLAINSLFFKILGGYSFIFLELVCTFLFLLIFYNIFFNLNFSKIASIVLPIIFFILPDILNEFVFLDIEPLKLLSLNFESFYSTRFPRPAISNLFFFSFIYFIIKLYKDDEKYLRTLFIISILIGLMVNIFFYLAFIELFLLLFVFLLKFKKKVFIILVKNYEYFFYCLLVFLSFVIIFQSQVYFSEPDYVKRLGVFSINSNQKKILFTHFFNFIFGIEFLFLFFINTFFFFFSKNRFVKIFYFLFLSSILSPILFFNLFDKGVDYYHFFNWIVICGFIFPFIAITYFIESIFVKFLNKRLYNSLVFMMILFSLFYFNFNNILDHKITDKDRLKRYELKEATNFISQNKLFNKKDLEIFNLNYRLSVWLLANDFSNFSLIPVSFWTPKTDLMLENELISSMKFLRLSKNDFHDLIKNKKSSWRFKNNFVFNFFGRKYLANSLISFNNNKLDYNKIEKKFIESNNLLVSHQVIIPKTEINRLLNKFDKFKKKATPNIVIIDKNSEYIPNTFSDENFCLIFSNNSFIIYSHKNLVNECFLIKN